MRFPLDITNHEPNDIITVAHRGGVVGDGAHENSRHSIQRAIERGYDINTFRYCVYPDAEQRHMDLSRRDIERFRRAGVDGFQVDSVYDELVFDG